MATEILKLQDKAKQDPKTILLPEGEEPRILKAAAQIAELGLAKLILLGNEKKIKKMVGESFLSLKDILIIEPEKYTKKDEVIETFYKLVSYKGTKEDEARKLVMEDTAYFGAILTRLGVADGFVAGASHTTPDVARASLYCLGLDKEIGIMSSSFVIELAGSIYGHNGLFVFGDCGIVPNPNSNKLAGIAISSSRLFEELFNVKARVALLSYSTKGSAKGESVEKVVKALDVIKTKKPDLMVDGELQFDAAVVPEVAAIKAPNSSVAGKANVLIFPNLDAGNISYKLAQRLGQARVVGPLLQGLTKPCSDLSRGCGVEEIIDAVVVTAVRAQKC